MSVAAWSKFRIENTKISAFGDRRWLKPSSVNGVMTCSSCCRSDTSKLELVITRSPLMTLNINLHWMLMNWIFVHPAIVFQGFTWKSSSVGICCCGSASAQQKQSMWTDMKGRRFPLQGWGGFAPLSQKPGGHAAPQPKPKIFRNVPPEALLKNNKDFIV